MQRSKIEAIGTYLPEEIVDNKSLENRINAHQDWLYPGVIEKLFGIKTRRFAAVNEQASDLAAKAAFQIVDEYGAENIECLIFASASSDLIEPATSNIIQQKLGLSCPVMDVKNACNSFVTGLQLASALINSGQYKNVLIATGEKPSDSIKTNFASQEEFRRSAASFSFGDAGSAVLVSQSDSESEILFHKFKTVGEHWKLCMIEGGGSMFPHDSSKNYFSGETAALRSVVVEQANIFIRECFVEAELRASDIDHLFTHQVSMEIFRDVTTITDIPKEKCHITFDKYGNTAAASIPLAIKEALEKSVLKKGQLILLIGMAAGISISFQLIRW